MTRQEIEACWQDPRNRKWGIYACKSDPRLIVPKHPKWMGWTPNFAHRRSILVTLLLIAGVAGPLELAVSWGAGLMLLLLIVLVDLVILCGVCVYLASRTA